MLKAGRCHPLALGWFAVWLTDNGIKRETEGRVEGEKKHGQKGGRETGLRDYPKKGEML